MPSDIVVFNKHLAVRKRTVEKIVTVNRSGNFKIPAEIKDSLSLKKDDKLLVFNDKESIIIKKISRPALQEPFDKLSKKTAAKFRKQDVSKSDVTKAVQWARK